MLPTPLRVNPPPPARCRRQSSGVAARSCVRYDLPVWQALYEDLKDRDFLPIAVALDSRGAAGAAEWIRAANPTYPSLIDEQHVVAELYDMVNVPSAVWIDEQGRIVRTTEPAGSSDAFRSMDLATRTIPPDVQAEAKRKRDVYQDALRDWAVNGAASRHVLAAGEARRRLPGPSDDHALAAANFRLGVHLHEHGQAQAAQRYFAEAQRLRPDSWSFKRQAFALEDPAKPFGAEFWAAVTALGEKRYYPDIEMEGMPR